MNSSQKGGKSKSSRSSSSKSKKGGNFLGSASELFVPTGWESFATAAGLLAVEQASEAFRRSKNSNKKQKGGADLDAHESLENMEQMMASMGDSSESVMSGGAKKKTGAKKSTAKKPAAKKPAAKKPAAKKPATKKPKKSTK